MATEVFDFRWSLPEAGYHWVNVPIVGDEASKPQWVLTDGLVPGQPYRLKRYAPLRMFTGLFRAFADLAPSREPIREFANQYGLLGIQVPMQNFSAENPDQFLGQWGETEEQWQKEITSMRRAVEIWDLMRTGDAAGLGRHLRWKKAGKGEHLIYDTHPDLPSFEEDWRRALPPEGRFQQMVEPVQDLIRPDDVVTAARILIQRWINQHLEGNVSPRLLYHTDLDQQVLRFVPKNLLGALWLQLAQAIDANKEYRACRECGKWYEVSLEGDGRTKRRQFCSDPCKSKDYRRRRDRARELHAKGRPVREIAQELGTELDSVKKWVRVPKA